MADTARQRVDAFSPRSEGSPVSSMFQSTFGDPEEALPPQTAADMVNAGAWILDVREPEEFAQGSIDGAVNVPLKTILVDGILALERAGLPDDGREVLVVCRSGMRSGNACLRLREALGQRAYNLRGGLMAWQQAGLPVTVKH